VLRVSLQLYSWSGLTCRSCSSTVQWRQLPSQQHHLLLLSKNITSWSCWLFCFIFCCYFLGD
jgi:hypothetical protein